MTRSLIRRLTGFLAILWMSMPCAASPDDHDPIRWRGAFTTVPDGARISLELDKPKYFLGENVLLHFVVENTSNKPFEIETGGDYRGASRPLRFTVTATDERGNPMEDPELNQMHMGGLAGRHEIAPGDKWYASLSLPRYRRFDQPGQYTIRAWHDLGWREDETHKRPVDETKITFVMPTAEEAEAIVAAMVKMPDHSDWRSGEKRSPYADFTVLRCPVYLDALAKRAKQGYGPAITGIGSIETRAATAELVGLLSRHNWLAARTLISRLPAPQWDGQVPPARPADPMEARQFDRVTKTWDPQFIPLIRPKARELVAHDKGEAVELGAMILRSVGTPEDQADLVSALDRALKHTVARTGIDVSVLDPPGVARHLLPALHQLTRRGAVVPDRPATLGQMALYLSTIAKDPAFRPEGWRDRSVACMAHPNPFIRELAVRAQPVPMPENTRAVLPGLFTDRDQGVQRAACEYASRARDPALKPAVLAAVASAQEHFTIDSANTAAVDLGAKYEASEIWIRRLDEPNMLIPALTFLSTIVKYPGHGWGGNRSVSTEEIAAIKLRWEAFLPANRERIQSGQLFEIGDPLLTPDLFGGAFQFHLGNGGTWPRLQE